VSLTFSFTHCFYFISPSISGRSVDCLTGLSEITRNNYRNDPNLHTPLVNKLTINVSLPKLLNWSGVAVACWSRSTKLTYVGPINSGMGDRVRVQFPVWDIYLGMWPATQINSAWPSLRG